MQKKVKALFIICLLSLLLVVYYRPAAMAAVWIGVAKTWHNFMFLDTTPSPLYGIETSDKIVALTFDDGPDARFTPLILDILKENSVQATFFVVGKNAEENPEILLRIKDEGHEIANHTYSHPEMKNISPEELLAQVKKTDTVVQNITGQNTPFMRPPKGVIDGRQLEILAEGGYQTALWNICLENKECKSPQEMAQRIITNIQPGNVVLMHDGRLDRTFTVKALPILIKGLKDKGFSFTTLSKLHQDN